MQHFEKLYIANIEEVSKKVENSFLYCGKNWYFYFTNKDNKTDFEELKNVKYMEFVDKKDFESFILSNKIIDYSIELDKSMVLYHG